MSYSISNKTTFAEIDWNTFENRPPIKRTMPQCKEKDWYADVKCCMDGYTIEHVRDMAYDNGYVDTPETQFLDEYPCLNGVELDYFVDIVTAPQSNIGTESESSTLACVSNTIFQSLEKILPKSLIDAIKPYLCRS